MKNITESINESKQTKYNVAFIPSKKYARWIHFGYYFS